MLRLRWTALLCVVPLCGALGVPVGAAQPSPCGDLASAPDELQVTPPDRADGVALDAPVVVRYPDARALAALLVALEGEGGDGGCGGAICLFREGTDGGRTRVPVEGRVSPVDERTLAFVPARALAPDTRYFAWIARPGFDGGARTEREFRSGGQRDREPPEFAPARDEIRVELDEPPPECGAEPGSVRVRLGVPRARDDTDERSVELLLFVTRAAGARGPTLRARTMNPEGDGEAVLTFLLAAHEAEQPVCVALRAVDGVGRASAGDTELCFDALQGSYFVPGCAGAGGPGRRAPAGVLIPLGVLLAIRLRRPRTTAR